MKTKLAALFILVSLAASCGGDATRSSQIESNPGSNAEVGVVAPDVGTRGNAVTETRVIVTSSIQLEVEALRSAYTAVGQIAVALRGYVARASISDQGKDASATLRLRVPAASHDEALNRLRGLQASEVLGEETDSNEVTAEYADLQSRMRNLQRSESQYQELMSRAASVGEIVQVSAKLDDVRGQIEQTQGRLNLLNDQTDLATVNVFL
jgi:hypothetical protein